MVEGSLFKENKGLKFEPIAGQYFEQGFNTRQLIEYVHFSQIIIVSFERLFNLSCLVCFMTVPLLKVL